MFKALPHNKSLHLTAFPLCSLATGEQVVRLGRGSSAYNSLALRGWDCNSSILRYLSWLLRNEARKSLPFPNHLFTEAPQTDFFLIGKKGGLSPSPSWM
jgi:hypothetical protein